MLYLQYYFIRLFPNTEAFKVIGDVCMYVYASFVRMCECIAIRWERWLDILKVELYY